MRTIVRLLPRLLVLGVAAGALFLVLDRARPAHAVDPPVGGDTIGLPPAPELPAVPAPAPAPSIPPPPQAPTLPEVPAPALPVVATAPGGLVPGSPPPLPPAPPGGPTVPTPVWPAAPEVPGVDLAKVTRALGPLPEVPSLVALAPELTELPALPDEAPPLKGLLDLVAAPPAAPPSPVFADSAPAAPAPELDASRVGLSDPRWLDLVLGEGRAPARAPPTQRPSPLHPCPSGATSRGCADPARLLPPGADDAARRAGLFADARAYVSALLFDPLLRPD
jgi:hypothetical protein